MSNVGKVEKRDRKWVLIDENGKDLFVGKTRVSCFRYAHENNIKIASYQHGGN